MSALDTLIAASIRLATTPPTPPAFDGDVNLVTPGVVGFVAIAVIAAATVLLIIDMTRRIRRSRYRSEIAEKLDAEEAAGTDGVADTRP